MTTQRLLVALGLIVLLAACSPKELEFSYRDLPAGDAARGAELYTQSIEGKASCLACHALDAGHSVGPSLAGYAAAASQRVKNQSAEEYTFISLVRPARHMVQGYSNTMPSDYAENLSRQQIADLIAYLLTLD